MSKQRQSWSIEEKLGVMLAVLSECQSVAEAADQGVELYGTGTAPNL